MLATLWQQCYQDSWQDSMVAEAFCHPAKFARGLIHRIYRHLLEQGYLTEGMTVLDPFGGVALGALDAMTYGLRYIGVELEPKFVALGNQNLELWRKRYGFTTGTLVQGDSRRLREVLAGAAPQCVVGSPPFHKNGLDCHGYGSSQTVGNSDRAWVQKWERGEREPTVTTYGTTPGQLGAMPPGAVVSSPPFGSGDSAGPESLHRRTDASAQAMRQIGGWNQGGGQTSPDNLAAATTDTFWSAAAQIMQELALLLPAGAVCAWVVKAYVKNKQIVPFPDQWRALCEAHGFVLVEEIHASLVEDHGTQEGLFGEAQRVTTEKKSFFRRLAEKKGSPRIDHETVLILRKDGSGGGMCCVSSPPFGESVCNGRVSETIRAELLAQGKGLGISGEQAHYGTTPGNLGNLPVGRR